MPGSKTPKVSTIRKRAITKQARRKNIKKCIGKKKDGKPCVHKVSTKCGNLYCNQHFNQWQLHGKEDKFKLCTARTQCYPNDPEMKGVIKLIPISSQYSQCESCRNHERGKDEERRNNVNKLNESTDKKFCKKCKAEIPPDKIITTKHNMPSPYCEHCFKQRQSVEANRPKRDRTESSKIYEQTPKRKASKKARHDAHPEKAYGYCNKYRENQLIKNGDEYRRKNAINQANTRKRHPEKKGESTKRYRTLPRDKYNRYIRRAETDGYDFDISFEVFKKLVEADCYYCGLKRGKNLNGIDRVDNDVGYLEENIVTACKICNNMKNTYNEATFILMCAHIADFNKIYRFSLYPEIFNDHTATSYSGYEHRSLNELKCPIGITVEQYNELHELPCYICDKKFSNMHSNGIDRFDNSKGYIIENCKPCCWGCNCMKGKADYDRFLFQCGYIALEHKARLDDLWETWTPSKSIKRNYKKLSKEELTEVRLKHKKEREARTLASKSPEARRIRMAQIRKEKNLANEDDIIEV